MTIPTAFSSLRTSAVLLSVVAVLLGVCGTARADVVDEWGTLALPPAPQLKPAVLDAKTTALLMLDFLPSDCGNSPRCLGTLPKVRPLLDADRAAHALVVYTEYPPNTVANVLPAVAPLGSEPNIIGLADKFAGSNLDQILKDHGIKTVIVVGAVANGAVLLTGVEATQHGYKVVVPVDGMSGVSPFAEGYTALEFTNAPTVSQSATVTRAAMVTFQ